MLDWFKTLFRTATPVALTPQPVAVTPSSPEALRRAVGRLSRLCRCRDHGDRRHEVASEILRHQAMIAAHGHEVPYDEAAALALLAKIGG